MGENSNNGAETHLEVVGSVEGEYVEAEPVFWYRLHITCHQLYPVGALGQVTARGR